MSTPLVDYNYPALRMRARRGKAIVCVDIFIYMSKNDKTASNTLNTYLYCCKSLPRTVNQILHLPSSLRSKNSLHGLRWGGFWIATPLPAIQTPPRHDITCTLRAAYAGLRCQKNLSEGSREPAISRRKRFVPTTILLLSKEG